MLKLELKNIPVNQFHFNGCNVPYRHDRNTNGGGILAYVRHDIRSRITECENLPSSFEGLIKRTFFNLKKWLLICTTIFIEIVYGYIIFSRKKNNVPIF